jgi:hypothetical protein
MNPQSSARPIVCPRPGGRHPLLWAALAFAAGLSAGLHIWRPPLWWVVAGAVFTAAGIYFRHRRAWAAFTLGLGAVFVTGALFIQVRTPGHSGSSGLLQFADGREVLITAHVTAEGILRLEGAGDIRQKLDVETEEIVAANQVVQIRSGLRVSLYGKEDATGVPPLHLFRYGER